MAVATKRLVHAHGCTNCKARYEDICDEPDQGGTCKECNGQLGYALLILNRLPRDCCRAHSRLVTKEQAVVYALSKACAWFICTVCARTQPFVSPTPEVES